jgi:hypothetical protein
MVFHDGARLTVLVIILCRGERFYSLIESLSVLFQIAVCHVRHLRNVRPEHLEGEYSYLNLDELIRIFLIDVLELF